MHAADRLARPPHCSCYAMRISRHVTPYPRAFTYPPPRREIIDFSDLGALEINAAAKRWNFETMVEFWPECKIIALGLKFGNLILNNRV